MRVINGVEGLNSLVGEHLGYSDWLLVEQDRVDQFADATNDHQWIHQDVARAAAGPFGGAIAHGYLTVSLIPFLVSQIYRVDGIQMAINYGSDKVRFPTAVPVGSKVRGGVELLAVAPHPQGLQVRVRVTVECDASAKPGCVAEILSVIVT
ncbi:MAG: MaoC family dehydratase [Jatrophihabitans sp.]